MVISFPARVAARLLRTRWLVRAPVGLYRARLGILLGPRFVLLEHTGRKTGATRHVVLEVVARPAPGTYAVTSGLGELAQWFRNIRVDPRVRVFRGSHAPISATARVLPGDEAAAMLTAYAHRHPRAWAAMRPVLTETLGRPGDDPVTGLPVVILDSRKPDER